jgi:hypothetical protein
MPEFGPRDLLDHTLAVYLKKSGVLINDPHVSSSVLCDSRYGSRYVADSYKTVIVEIAKPKRGGNPDSSCIILKERVRNEPFG